MNLQNLLPLAPVGALIVALIMLCLNGNFDRLTNLWGTVGGRRKPEVVIGIVLHERRVLLVQRRPKPNSPFRWQFPAGYLTDSYPDPSDKIKREVEAETGIIVNVEGEIGSRFHAGSKKFCVYYACSYVSGQPVLADPHENIDVRWVEVAEVEAYVGKGIFRKVKAWLKTHGA